MTIDLINLFKRKTKSLNIDLIISEKDFFQNNDEIKVSHPVSVKGTVDLVGDLVHLNVDVHVELSLQCSRCLGEYSSTLNFNIQEDITNNYESKDDDLIFIEGDSINITEIIETDIELTLPFKKLCSDDCKGLCHSCGVNLNSSTCTCDDVKVDPRLSVLKDFFSTD